MVPWDKIEIMEVIHPVINEHVVSDTGSINGKRHTEQEINH